MKKSYASLENRVCPVCGVQHDNDCGVLLDTRLKDSMEHTTVTGYGMCKEHADLWEKGFVALVVINASKSNVGDRANVVQEDVYRTGQIIHMAGYVFESMFNQEKKPIVFIDEELAHQLEAMSIEGREGDTE